MLIKTREMILNDTAKTTIKHLDRIKTSLALRRQITKGDNRVRLVFFLQQVATRNLITCFF